MIKLREKTFLETERLEDAQSTAQRNCSPLIFLNNEKFVVAAVFVVLIPHEHFNFFLVALQSSFFCEFLIDSEFPALMLSAALNGHVMKRSKWLRGLRGGDENRNCVIFGCRFVLPENFFILLSPL